MHGLVLKAGKAEGSSGHAGWNIGELQLGQKHPLEVTVSFD